MPVPPKPSQANLLTFSAYGDHVPGDSRGSSRRGEYVPANPNLERYIRSRMAPSVTFSPEERNAGVCALSDFCCKHKIIVGAINARESCVLALIYSEAEPGITVIERFKRAVSLRLHKLFPRFLEIEKIWATKGSVAPIYSPQEWLQAMRYVAEGQGDNSYMTPEEWIWRSSIWTSNPFDPNCLRDSRFDGQRLTFGERR